MIFITINEHKIDFASFFFNRIYKTLNLKITIYFIRNKQTLKVYLQKLILSAIQTRTNKLYSAKQDVSNIGTEISFIQCNPNKLKVHFLLIASDLWLTNGFLLNRQSLSIYAPSWTMH